MFAVSIGMMFEPDHVYLVALRRGMRDIRIAGQMRRSLSPDAPLSDRLGRGEDLLAVFREETGIRDAELHIGIPDKGFLYRELTLPSAVKENLTEALGYQMEKILPLPPDEIAFSHDIISEDRAEGLLHILLGVGRKNELLPYQDLARRLQGGASGLHVSATAITTLLAEAGALPSNEVLKYAAGLLTSGHSDGSREDGSQDSGHPDPDQISDLLALYGLSSDDMASFGPACGLALMGLRPPVPCLNFLPVSWRRKPSRIPIITFAALAILLIFSAGLAGGGWWHHRNQIRDLQEKEVKRLAAEAIHADKLRRRMEEGTGRLAEMARFGNSGISALDMLRELTQQIPETAWVTELRIADSTGQITGEAQKAADLIGLLESSPLMKDVVFTSAITRTPEGKERFSIRFVPEHSETAAVRSDDRPAAKRNETLSDAAKSSSSVASSSEPASSQKDSQ